MLLLTLSKELNLSLPVTETASDALPATPGVPPPLEMTEVRGSSVDCRVPRSKSLTILQGYYIRESVPQRIPDKPPYTAHLGNLSYDATNESVSEFFADCDIVNVRIIEDREQMRPKGFAYAEFGNVEGLKKALTLDGTSFQGRTIKIKIADPREYLGTPRLGRCPC